MPNTQNIIEAAEILYHSQLNKITVLPIRKIIGDSDVDMAYKVQEVNINKRIASGEKMIGKKIGLTSFAVMEQLGVDQPDYGILFDSMQVKNGLLPFDELMQPKAEAEIAFIMGEDLDENFNITDLIDAIDYATVGIEIVGSRIADWDIKITDTIADNASASHFILGESKVNLEDLDLAECEMSMKKNGKIVSEGTGAACMDNPLNAALWLAKKMAAQGSPICKGDILLSGALGPMQSIVRGDVLEASIDGLGCVKLVII